MCSQSVFSLKDWCLCDFPLPLPHLPFLIECTLCWKIRLNRLLGFPFRSPAAKGKGQLMYRIIFLLFPIWSMKNERADLYSHVPKMLRWKYILRGTKSGKWFHRPLFPIVPRSQQETLCSNILSSVLCMQYLKMFRFSFGLVFLTKFGN